MKVTIFNYRKLIKAPTNPNKSKQNAEITWVQPIGKPFKSWHF